MMMHQNSSQGQPPPPPPSMMAMGMAHQQPGMYGAAGAQQQSELHQNWVPQRSPIVAARRFSRGAASSPTPPPPAGAHPQSPHLSQLHNNPTHSTGATAAIQGYLTPPGPTSSFALQRSQTFNSALGAGNVSSSSGMGGMHGTGFGGGSVVAPAAPNTTVNSSFQATYSDGSPLNTVGNMMRGGAYPPHHFNNHHQPHHFPPNGRGNGPAGFPTGQPHHPGGTPVVTHVQPAAQQPPPPPPAGPQSHPNDGDASK